MARRFNTNIHCPCGKVFTAETDFERWIRNHEGLQSAGIVRFDLDILLHKYLVVADKRGPRSIQCMMFIEVKTFDAEPSIQQRDTLSLLSQVMRNRRTNIHRGKKGRHAMEHTPLAMAYSQMNQRWIRLRLFGGHLLQFSRNDPTDSDSIRWDTKPIDTEDLIGLLKFELDPDEPGRPMDWRRRYSSFESEVPDFEFVTDFLKKGVGNA